MIKKLSIVVLLILALVLPMESAFALCSGGAPDFFYGTLKINGVNASADTQMRAKILGDLRGFYNTSVAGRYGNAQGFDKFLVSGITAGYDVLPNITFEVFANAQWTQALLNGNLESWPYTCGNISNVNMSVSVDIQCQPSQEVCDGVDNDCDSQIDEDYASFTCGIGACQSQSTCVNGVESCNPGAPTIETCNGADDNCNGNTDEGGNALCIDNSFCDGQEVCGGSSGCLEGAPVNCDDGIGCTIDACNEDADSCVVLPDDSACDNAQFCDGAEFCDAQLGCQSSQPVDCSGNDIEPIGTCDNVPDSNSFTFDFRAGFGSACDEQTDSCTAGNSDITSTCDTENCGAECEDDSDCEPIDCTLLNGCDDDGTFREYPLDPVPSTCDGSCGCQPGQCNDFDEIITDSDEDGFDVECDNDCDDDDKFINPNADEACDGIDNDCDGLTDEDNVCGPECDDFDVDGVCNEDDNCPLAANEFQEDSDLDGVGDACDICDGNDNIDTDEDGTPDDCDDCPIDPFNDNDDDTVCGDENGNDACPGFDDNEDLDFDDIPDGCDPDVDGDGFSNINDNCPDVPNPDQGNADNDGLGNACDPDDDNDGVNDIDDNCQETPNFNQSDSDGDGIGDVCDICSQGNDNIDSDEDGTPDDCDNCPNAPNADQEDLDEDGIGSACDENEDTFETSITIYDGWTLFALPFKPLGINDTEELGQAIINNSIPCDVILRFNGETQEMESDILGLPDPSFALSGTEGYFIHCFEAATFSYEGVLWV